MVILEHDITALLSQSAGGDHHAAEKLMPLVYEELRRVAHKYMRRERQDHILQTTALVHEAYLRLVRQPKVNWQCQAQFLGIAAQMMRRILIDHARGRLREKRKGATEDLPLDDALAFSPEHSEELVRVDEALQRLSALDPRQGKVVELRFFGGLTVVETSKFLGISPKTVKRDWAVAKAWLHGELRRKDGDFPSAVGQS